MTQPFCFFREAAFFAGSKLFYEKEQVNKIQNLYRSAVRKFESSAARHFTKGPSRVKCGGFSCF